MKWNLLRKQRRLPEKPLRGRFYISQAAIQALEKILPSYHGSDGSHEGIAFLCGLEFAPDITVLTTAIAPKADHGWGHVRCSEQQMTQVTRAAHRLSLGVLAQVHSHPGKLVEHSEGDDEMVLMPFEGMLSIVVPLYASTSLQPIHKLGIHQFQDGKWIVASMDSIRNSIIIIPSGLDVR